MIKGEPQELTRRQQKGRALNAVAEMLRQRLSVPNIYLEPRSPSIAADILAVDRAGSGDLYAVEIKLENDFEVKSASRNLASHLSAKLLLRKRRLQEIHEQIMSLSAHFRYLAIEREVSDRVIGELGPLLYSPDGIGRIGIIVITDRGENPPTAELSIAPERFRVDPVKLRNIEKKLLEKVRPDIEVRI